MEKIIFLCEFLPDCLFSSSFGNFLGLGMKFKLLTSFSSTCSYVEFAWSSLSVIELERLKRVLCLVNHMMTKRLKSVTELE